MSQHTKTVNADLTATEAELLAAAQALYSYGELSVEFDAEMGEFAVWTSADKSADYPGEIIGSGTNKSEAIAEALVCLRVWEAP